MATLIGWLNSVFGSTGAPVAVLLLGIVTFVVIASGPTLWSDWRNRRLYKNRAICQAVAEALGKLGDTRAVEPLIAALQDEDVELRRAAAQALGEIGDSRAVEPLIAALRDKDIELRRVAARALGEIEDAQAVEPLLATLEPIRRGQ